MSGRGCFNCGGCAWFCSRCLSSFVLLFVWAETQSVFWRPRDHHSLFTPFFSLLFFALVSDVRWSAAPTICKKKVVVNLAIYCFSTSLPMITTQCYQHYNPKSSTMWHELHGKTAFTCMHNVGSTMSAKARQHLHTQSIPSLNFVLHFLMYNVSFLCLVGHQAASCPKAGTPTW